MLKPEALNILNPEEKTTEAIKAAYRKLSLKHHPDHGGDIEIMKVVNAAYECLKDLVWSEADKDNAEKMDNVLDALLSRWDKIKGYKTIRGEIIGTWLWISGETWRFKKLMKAEDFKWSRSKKSWYYHVDAGYKKKGKKKFSMDEIRGMWGSETLVNDTVVIA